MLRRTYVAAWKSVGPIVISALSFFCSAALLHHLALALDPSFSFFALSGIGKLAIMCAGIMQALAFAALQPKPVFNALIHGITWPASWHEWPTYLWSTGLFVLLHLVVLGGYVAAGSAVFQFSALPLLIKKWPIVLLCMVGTFALAWAEELIFRGLLFSYFRQHHGLFASAVTASFIFMILHDLRTPLSLVTTKWQLGLGLFLLGLFLNLVMVWKKSIAASAGVHSGLVVVKAILRKIPLIPVMAPTAYLFPFDLRQSLIIHGLMVSGIIFVWKKIQSEQH